MDGLGMSPFEVIYGRKPNFPIDLLIGREISGIPINTPDKHRELVMKNAEKLFPAIREARKQRFERNQRQDGDIRNHEFSRGDKVYLHFPKGRFRPVGGSTKFSKVNDGPYTVVEVREDDLICKVRHDTTGYVSNVFVGRMIPCEKRDDSRDDADFPYPLAQLPSRSSHSLADSGAGAENKDSPEHDFDLNLIDEEIPMELEEESTAWEEQKEFPQEQPRKGRGRPKKGLEAPPPDSSDLRHKYTDSAKTRGERLKAREAAQVLMKDTGQQSTNLWYQSRGFDELHPSSAR